MRADHKHIRVLVDELRDAMNFVFDRRFVCLCPPPDGVVLDVDRIDAAAAADDGRGDVIAEQPPSQPSFQPPLVHPQDSAKSLDRHGPSLPGVWWLSGNWPRPRRAPSMHECFNDLVLAAGGAAHVA